MLLKEFLDNFPPPGRVIFAKVWGSRSHNTHKDTSDTDFAGVYLCPTSEILSLKPPAPTFKYDAKEGEINKEEYPDHAFYEAAHFANLLLVGNPGILEYLYTEKLYMTTPEWESLKAIRDRFLSVDSIHQYLGYMNGQLKRLINGLSLHTTGGKYNEKWAYHIMRLIGDAKRIAQGKPPVVWKDGEERLLLMKIRGDEVSWEDVKKMIEDGIEEIKAMGPYPLPQSGDAGALQDWLLDLRRNNW
jgi:predicted nucleotidyltransferase